MTDYNKYQVFTLLKKIISLVNDDEDIKTLTLMCNKYEFDPINLDLRFKKCSSCGEYKNIFEYRKLNFNVCPDCWDKRSIKTAIIKELHDEFEDQDNIRLINNPCKLCKRRNICESECKNLKKWNAEQSIINTIKKDKKNDFYKLMETKIPIELIELKFMQRKLYRYIHKKS